MTPGRGDLALRARRWAPWLLAAALLLLLAGQLGAEAWGDSLTYDETRYLRTGACAWSTRTIDLEVSNPPAHKLLAGAGLYLAGLHPDGSCADDQGFFPRDPDRLRPWILAARAGAVTTGVLLALVVLLWSRALFGTAAGLLSLTLVALEPTVLGHAHLVTGDALVSLAIVACLAAHWRWLQTRSSRWLAAAGAAMGLGLLSKPTILVVVPVIVAAELMAAGGPARQRVRATARPVAILLATGWCLVCLVYLPFRQSHGGWPPPLSWLAPPSWFASLADSVGAAPGHVNYLNGDITPGDRPFPLYFLEALGLKTSLGLLALAALAAILTVRRRDRTAALHLWLPAGLVVLAASAGAVDVGVRYVLPVLPLLAVAAGMVVAPAGRLLPWRRAAGLAACTAVAASSLAHAPLHLGYFNELVPGRPERLLADSNLDWGQDAWRLRDWWRSRGSPPLSFAYFGTLSLDRYGIRGTEVFPGRQAVHGLLAVSLTRLTVIGDDTRRPYAGRPYRDLQRLTPVDRIGTSIVVFDLGR